VSPINELGFDSLSSDIRLRADDENDNESSAPKAAQKHTQLLSTSTLARGFPVTSTPRGQPRYLSLFAAKRALGSRLRRPDGPR